MELEAVAAVVVDAGLKVHRTLGPGLLESAYEHFLCHELQRRSIGFARQVALPVVYEGETIDVAYRLDIVVENAVVVEVKAVELLTQLHRAQLLTYLKLSDYPLGFLMNFNVPLFKDGVRRLVR